MFDIIILSVVVLGLVFLSIFFDDDNDHRGGPHSGYLGDMWD